jgi:hypothetical protein
MLFQITTFNKYGTLKQRIFYSEKEPNFKSDKHLITRFKYSCVSEINPPSIVRTIDNTYIVPGWIKVDPQTTLEDVHWIKPDKIEAPISKDKWTFKSNTSDSIYTVEKIGFKYKCNCPGFWRSKDRDLGCKHIQEVKKGLI